MQLKITTVAAGATTESTIGVSGEPKGHGRNAQVLHAVSGIINMLQQVEIESIKVEVIA